MVKIGIIARRLRKSVEPDSAGNAMETVVCGKCGQRFAIQRDANTHDAGLIEKQTAWVQDQLVWDHIQERRHHGSMELPNFQ